MRSMATLWKSATIAATSALLLLTAPVQAETVDEAPSAGAMVADALVARPLYFALSQVGALVYGATLPFTLMGGNANQAAETLVVTPLQGAFVRCLGCGKINSQVGSLSEADGSKRIQTFVMLSAGSSRLEVLNGTKTETQSGGNFGVFLGTHFALSDKSRFDVMLGAKRLATVQFGTGATKVEDTLNSYQIVSRFGRDLGPVDLMFKLGGHYAELDRTGALKDSKGGFNILYGVGLDAHLSDRVRLGLDFTRYNLPDMPLGYEKNNLNSIDLNLGFMF